MRDPGRITRYFCDFAFLGRDRADVDVLVEVDADRIRSVAVGEARPPGAVHLRGLTLPGLANAHSHAFHRALRGRTERPGNFWSWREQMYSAAAALDPEHYRRLARAVFGEMALAGITAVGEFHYLHHAAGGVPYQDPNEMGEALFEAATAAGIRITLLDACYLRGGPGRPVEGAQRRFSDGDAETWAERAAALRPPPGARIGAAVHSLRAVPPESARVVAEWASGRDAPLHFHLSEQPAENDEVRAAYGTSPAGVLRDVGALGPSATAVHATHLTTGDVTALASSATTVCLCPTTERSLADGIGPAGSLDGAGARICVGTDGHALIDVFEEVRAVEMDERLATGERGHFSGAALLEMATATGHASLGWPEAGRLAPGALADLVTVGLDSPRMAGAAPDCLLEQAVFGGSAADVTDVVVSGRPVVRDGHHLLVEDVGAALSAAVGKLVEGMAAGS